MDANDRMEKQMEGTNLALAAVAEVLQKMDSRLRKEEEDSEEEELEKAAVASRQDLVKSIANEVIGVLKSELNGMDVSGDERKAAGTGGTPADADDSESAVTPNTKIEDQQNTIQAMLKNDDEESEEEEAEKGGYGMKQEDEDEYPVAEEPGDEGDSDELKAMKSQLDAMKKQLEAYESGMQKAIQDESENRLRKMGFAESTTLKAPASLMNLGTDDVAPIQKGSDSSDFMEDLTNVSYGELRKLQHQIEMGETDGLPRELIGG